jgi:nucleoid-associated protein YgaU
MALWDGLGTTGRAVAGLGTVAVVSVAGYFGLVKAKIEPAPQEVVAVAPAAVVAAAKPEVAPVAAVAAPVAQVSGQVAAVLPSFDVVRVAPDGAATVAGTAGPGAAVSLQVDGAEVAVATADGQGKFAALFDLPPSPKARMLSLVATLPGGGAQIGAQTVALAPIAEPVVVAADQPVVTPPAALLVAPEGVKVLQPAEAVPAEVAANVSVETITYAADGAVVLGGHGQANGALRIYLDQASVADVTAQADGAWGVTLADVKPGIYTLRVDQLDAGGKVTSRFETPFKRETLEALATVAAPEVAVAAVEPVVAAEPKPVVAAPVVAAPVVAAPTAAVDPAPAETVVAVAEPEKVVEQAVVAAAEPVKPSVAEPAVTPAAEAVAKVDPAPAPVPVTITVQPGYTLWGIAQKNFGDGVMYVQVFAANKDKIKNPDLIYPGQVFTIPAQP